MSRKLISFDWALKKLLRSKANFGILEGFLSELLLEDVKIKEILESESNRVSQFDKANRVDIKVKNSKGEIIIIEIQFNEEWDYFQRILFATSKAITEHIDKGYKYEEVVKVISINILYFDLGQGKDYVYHGTTNFYGIHQNDELELSEQQKKALNQSKIYQIFPEYYLLKINNFDDKAKNTFDEWVYFLKNEEIKPEFKAKGLKEAKEKLDIMKLSEKKRKEYEAYIENRRIAYSEIWTASEKGRMEGRTEGRIEGKVEGKIEGKMEEKVEIAKNLLDILDNATISQKTGLSIKEVEQLRENQSKNNAKEKSSKYIAKKNEKRVQPRNTRKTRKKK